MNQITEPSMYERPEWPLNALPQHWIEALFAKMSAFYGSKFAAMWSGSKPLEVQKAWAIELAKLSKPQLKAGSDALTAFARPPTLPEFVAHCRQTRLEAAVSTAPRIENRPTITPEQAQENIRKLRIPLVGIMDRGEPTAEWAYQLLMRGDSKDKPLTHGVVRCATDAITSGAGRRVVETCTDPEMREEYRTIREAVLESYREKGRPVWEGK